MTDNSQADIIQPVSGVEDIANPVLAGIYEYWRGLRKGGALPLSKDVDLLDLDEHLNNVYLFDILDNGADYRCVYNGNFYASATTEIGIGQTVGSMPPSKLKDRIGAAFDAVVLSGQPAQFFRAASAREGREYRTIDMLCLPLSDDGSKVSRTLSALHLTDDPYSNSETSEGN